MDAAVDEAHAIADAQPHSTDFAHGREQAVQHG
jgi:hypothetical protein